MMAVITMTMSSMSFVELLSKVGLQGKHESTCAAASEARSRRCRLYQTRFTGAFLCVVCDEDQQVKTIATRQHQSVVHLQHQYNWFLTATTMWNNPSDLCGTACCSGMTRSPRTLLSLFLGRCHPSTPSTPTSTSTTSGPRSCLCP